MLSQVAAFDGDIGPNGDLEYSIYGGESTQAMEYFRIEAASGLVTLQRTIEGLGKLPHTVCQLDHNCENVQGVQDSLENEHSM